MSQNITTSPYTQSHIDYDGQDPRIQINMDYVNSLKSEGEAGVLAAMASSVVKNPLAGAIVTSLPGGFNLTVAVDEQDPLAASVELATLGGSIVVGGSLALAFNIVNGTKVLSATSKTNLISWVSQVLLTNVVEDGIKYEMVSELYKRDYKIEYDRAKNTSDIIVNAGTSSLEDIKEFLYYSNVLKESDDVYVKQGSHMVFLSCCCSIGCR